MKTFSILSILSFTILLANISQADVYKWVDKNGKVHFGDRPSSQGKGKVISQKKTPISSKHSIKNPSINTGNRSNTSPVRNYKNAVQCQRVKAKLQEYKDATVTADEATVTAEDVRAGLGKFEDIQWVRDKESVKSFERLVGMYCEGRVPAPRKRATFTSNMTEDYPVNKDNKNTKQELAQPERALSQETNREHEENIARCKRYKSTLQEYEKDSEVITSGPHAGEVAKINWNKSSDKHIQTLKELTAKYCTE